MLRVIDAQDPTTVEEGEVEELTEQNKNPIAVQQWMMERAARIGFGPIPSYQEMNTPQMVWKFLRLLELNPDEFLAMAGHWFGEDHACAYDICTLEEWNPYEKDDFLNGIQLSLETKYRDHPQKLDWLLHRVHKDLATLWEIRYQHWTPEWSGYQPKWLSGPWTAKKPPVQNVSPVQQQQGPLRIKSLSGIRPGSNGVVVGARWLDGQPAFLVVFDDWETLAVQIGQVGPGAAYDYVREPTC